MDTGDARCRVWPTIIPPTRLHKKSARGPPPVPELARVRCQCLRLECGLVRIGSVVYVCLCGAAVGQSKQGILCPI